MKKRKSPFLVFICCVLAVPTVAMLAGELVIDAGLPVEDLVALLRPWLAVGTLLGLARLVLRPIFRFLSAPLGCLTLGLFGFLIDIGLIYGCALLVDGFPLPSLAVAALTALLVNVITGVTGEWRR